MPADKIFDNKIDIKISIKTTKKTFQFTKTGVLINPDALKQPVVIKTDSTSVANPTQPTDVTQPIIEPKTVVSKFLNNLNAQNLKAAFDSSQNPNWTTFESFSNQTSGFGAVKSISIKNISPNQSTSSSASVTATYEVSDKSGNTVPLKVNFGLKNINGEWKISSYQIQ